MDDYSPEVLQEYIDDLTVKVNDGSLKRKRYYLLTSTARRVDHFARTGTYLWGVPKRGTRYELDSYYMKLVNEFIASDDFHPNTAGDLEWVARRYFYWLWWNDIKDVGLANQEIIQKYLHNCLEEMKPASVYNVHLYLKKLYLFLFERGYTDSSYAEFFAFKICRESKLYPAADDKMVNAILNVIDTQTITGKRDYAIILLGYVLGMRSIDIARLKLSEIHWANGEIRFTQKKTGKTIVLPLTTDVGEALQDYILHGRPKTDYEEVFIRALPPYLPFKDPFCINSQFGVYCKRAGIERKAGDGLGFHSLRRAAGKRMVTSGTTINTVAQILGHTSIESTKKYIALDSEHLAECALDFSGIDVEDGNE